MQPWEPRRSSFCPNPAQARIVTLGSVPRSVTRFPSLLNYQCSDRGVGVGPAPGTADNRLQHAPGLRSSSNSEACRPRSATGYARSSRFRCPGWVPLALPGAPPTLLVPRCEEGTLRSSFHLPRNAPFTLNSHPSPSSFREPLTLLHSRNSPPWLSLKTPYLPSGDLPVTSPSPTESPLSHTPFFLKLSRYFHHPPRLLRGFKGP